MPKDAIVDKSFLIKNILPIYLAKGNKKSFDYFLDFYSENADVRFPKDEILRDQMVNIRLKELLELEIVSTFYVGDGTTKIFKLGNQSQKIKQLLELTVLDNTQDLYKKRRKNNNIYNFTIFK